MDWKEYEGITRIIFQYLGRQEGVKIVGYGPTCKVTGKSGVPHQIDILTSSTDGSRTSRTAIECKYLKKKINKEVVMKLAAITEDTGIEAGVIVCKAGFTPDGMKFAASKGIRLVELREINDNDDLAASNMADIAIGLLNFKTVLRRPKILTVKFDTAASVPSELNQYQWNIKTKDGKIAPFDSYVMIFKNMLHGQRPQEICKTHVSIDGGTMINFVTGEEFEISGFSMTGVLTIKNDSSKIELVDKVWLLMKAFFEDKEFSISRSGFIKTVK